MSLSLGVVGLIGCIAVAALVISIVVITTGTPSSNGTLTNPVLVHPGAKNATTAPPTVAVGGGLTGIQNPVIVTGSTDTSGLIAGSTTGGQAAELVVNFGTPYAVAPNAVVLSRAGTSTEYTVSPYVAIITKTGFNIFATPTSTISSTGLLYYIVL